MLRFYWILGRDMDAKKESYAWGSRFYNQVSKDLSDELPDVKSFSPRNLLYMHQFYKLFPDALFVPQTDVKLPEAVITQQPVSRFGLTKTAQEKLKAEDTRKYVENAFRDGALKTTGTDIDKILPPVSRFGGGRAKKKQTVLEKLKAFFEKYFGLGIHDSAEDEVEKVAYNTEETKLEMAAEDQESLVESAKKNSELTSLIVETVEE